MGGGPVFTGKELSFNILVACIVAAMGVIVFGYDIMRNSGGETSSCWYLAALLSSLVAYLVASTVARKFGPRLSRLSAAVIVCFGALVDTLAVNVAMLILGHILLGFGVGFAANQSVPN